MTFTELIGISAIVCYVLAIILNNAGFGSLALGLTLYSIKFGVV